LALAADKTFSVAGVPVGSYFLELEASTTGLAFLCPPTFDSKSLTIVQLYELTSSTPDLAYVTSARPGVAIPQSPPSVTFNVTGMTTAGTRDLLFAVSSQAASFQLFGIPATGTTSFNATFDWIGGVPDSSKKDSVFVYQRNSGPIGSGPTLGTVARVTKFAKLVDLTVDAVNGASADVTLGDVTQMGSLTTDLRNSQAAALTADVNPGATLNGIILNVLAVPHSLTYPDRPFIDATSIFALSGTSAADIDYGTVSYGQFLDGFWKEERCILYAFGLPSAPGIDAFIFSRESLPASTAGGIRPVIGPPKAPRVNGATAFTAQNGIGLQPTISWSAPGLGSPTSYVVDMVADSPCDLAAGQVAGVSAVVRSGTSFKVPPDILKAGIAYRVTITARQAPWETADVGPFRTGTPSAFAQCVSSTFVP